MNSTLNFIDGHQISYAVAGAWLQGHAVWHVLTMGALGCIYWFFRSERLVE